MMWVVPLEGTANRQDTAPEAGIRGIDVSVVTFKADANEGILHRAEAKAQLEPCFDLSDGGKGIGRGRCLLQCSRLSFAEENALTKPNVEGEPLREGAPSRDPDARAPTVELIAADDRLSAALLYVFEAAVTKAPCDRDAEFSAVNGVPDESVDIVEINFTAEARRVEVVVAAVIKPGDFPEEAALVFKTNLAAESQIPFAFVAAAAGTVGIHIEERALHEESWIEAP